MVIVNRNLKGYTTLNFDNLERTLLLVQFAQDRHNINSASEALFEDNFLISYKIYH
jgi:hypothetical protein